VHAPRVSEFINCLLKGACWTRSLPLSFLEHGAFTLLLCPDCRTRCAHRCDALYQLLLAASRRLIQFP